MGRPQLLCSILLRAVLVLIPRHFDSVSLQNPSSLLFSPLFFLLHSSAPKNNALQLTRPAPVIRPTKCPAAGLVAKYRTDFRAPLCSFLAVLAYLCICVCELTRDPRAVLFSFFLQLHFCTSRALYFPERENRCIYTFRACGSCSTDEDVLCESAREGLWFEYNNSRIRKAGDTTL